MEQKQVKHIDLGEINVSICIGASTTIEAVIEQNKGGTTVNKQYISDLIGEDVISTWEPGQILMIISGTDTGKSYFIRNRVYEHFKAQDKKVLYLVSRTNLKEQFQLPMVGETNITFMTYQAIETILSDSQRSIGEWDVIICDECHYFISDSAFNKRTDISFDWVMGQKDTIRIFLSATGDGIDRHLSEEKIAFDKITLPICNRQIRSLTYFNNETQMEQIAEQVISNGEKGIFFLSNLEMALSLYRKFKENSLFLCSKYRKPYARYMDEESISRMIEAERFDCNLLFATSAIDAGVSIKDPALKTIVVDMLDTNTLIQCVGRKRVIDNTDYFDLYIRNYNNNRIGGKVRSLKCDIGMVEQLENEGDETYNAKHGRTNDSSGIIYDKPVQVNGRTYFIKAVNKLRYSYTRQTIEVYQEILRKGVGFAKYVSGLLEMKKYSLMEAEQKKLSLSTELEKFVGKPMFTRYEKEPFIHVMDVGRKKTGDMSRSYSVLAAYLESKNLPYRLERYRTSRIDPDTGKKKTYNGVWKLNRI